MIWSRRIALALCLSLPVGGLGAHPHVFVDVALTFTGDGAGNFSHVEVTWTYDDFFSLLILSDMGMDGDGDGALTEEELDRLKGFDLVEWPEGFEGDLYVHRGEQKIVLDHPVPTSVALKDGQIVATHERNFGPVPGDGLKVEAYDPTYYVEYTLTAPITLPQGCRAVIREPDLDESQRAFRNMLNQLSTEQQYEGVEVGNLFSQTLFLSCAAPS